MAHPIMRQSCDCDNLGRVAPTTLAALETAYFLKRRSSHAVEFSVNCESEEKPVFPFMKLPPEIRGMIYTIHFDQKQKPRKSGTLCPAGSACPYRIYNNWVPVRALILVSKTFYNESMPLYYRSKSFGFNDDLDKLARFLDTIGALQRSFVTNFSFIYDKAASQRSATWRVESYAVTAFRALAECPALHTLHIGFELALLPSNNRELSTSSMTVLDLDRLLRFRGLTTVDVVVYDPRNLIQGVAELETRLQVMKRPRRF